MRKERNRPGDRIGEKQNLCRMVLRKPEDGRNPEDAEPAGAEHRDNGRRDTVAHAADGADNGVHHAAEEIDAADDAEAYHTGSNGGVCIRVNAKQRRTEENGKVSEQQACGNGAELGADQDSVDSGIFSRPDVLACKRECRLMEAVHGYPDEALNIGGSRAACNHGISQRVDGRLDNDVRKREDYALESCRHADFYKHPEGRPVNAELLQYQPEGVLFLRQTAENHCCGKILGENGGKCDTGNIHMKYDNEQKV